LDVSEHEQQFIKTFIAFIAVLNFTAGAVVVMIIW